MGDYLGPFSEASDRFECQELGVVAIIGQGGLQEVKFKLEVVTQLLNMLETWFLWQNQMFRGMGNQLGPFLEA